jgi:uncharacterized protein YjbJ (UPF0337 family)
MTTEEKSIGDRAKEAAEKAKEAAVKAKDKVGDFVGEHEDQIDSAIDKTGSFVDEKITKGRFTEKIDKAQDVAKGAVGKIAKKPEDGEPDLRGPGTAT